MKIIKYGEMITEEEIDLITQVMKDNVQCANEVFIDELPGYNTYDESQELVVINYPEDGEKYELELDI